MDFRIQPEFEANHPISTCGKPHVETLQSLFQNGLLRPKKATMDSPENCIVYRIASMKQRD
jgi:hypothetical protein